MVKKTGFLDTDDVQIFDNNDDVNLDDDATVDFNDTQPNEIDEIEVVDLKKTSPPKAIQKAAQKDNKNA